MPRAVFDSDHEARLQALRDMIATMDSTAEPADEAPPACERLKSESNPRPSSTYRINGTQEDAEGSYVTWVCESTGEMGQIACAKAVMRRVEGKRELRRRSFATLGDLSQALNGLEPGSAWSRTVDLLKSRDRTTKEIQDRLIGEGFSAQSVGVALERARVCGYIDDARYGATYVRTHQRKGWGRSKIERGLEERGIDPACIDGYPESFFGMGEEMLRAQEALASKRIPETKPVEKLARFLIGRGFAPSLALRVAKERVTCG